WCASSGTLRPRPTPSIGTVFVSRWWTWTGAGSTRCSWRARFPRGRDLARFLDCFKYESDVGPCPERPMSVRSIAVLTLLVLGACGGETVDEAPTEIWRAIEGGWLLDVEAGERIANPGVLIDPDGRIAQVGAAGTPAPEVQP